jgi:predicted ATPase
MLKRIKITNYKSLKDVDVSLHELSVFIGPNAAGKSNFLDALQLLSRIAASRTLKEAFEPPYRGKPLESFTFGEKGIKGLLEQGEASFEITADIELSQSVVDSVNRQIREMKQTTGADQSNTEKTKTQSFVHEKFLRYRIKVEILPRSGVLRIADEYVAALRRDGSVGKRRSPFLENKDGKLQLRMEGQAHPRGYDGDLNHSMLSIPLYAPHYPHLAALRQELASWFFYYFEPRERMRAASPVREMHHIGMMGEELASFLNTLHAKDPRQFEAVEKALHMIIPDITGIDVGVNELGEVELKLCEGKTPIPARLLSEGTLRVLGLLALGGAKEPPALIGFEEPENGIHPRRIRMVADLLKTRTLDGKTQLIVTTHSPILPDIMSDEDIFVCRKKDGYSTIAPFTASWPLGRKTEIDSALDDKIPATPISQRIQRGDFD